jgi:hypothetical protein
MFKINENKNNFLGNRYDHGFPTFGRRLSFKFKPINILTLCQLIVAGSVKQHEAQVKLPKYFLGIM